VPDEAPTTGAIREDAAATLAAHIGDYAGRMIRAGADQLEATYPRGLPNDTTAEALAAVVLLGAMSGFTRDEIAGGLLEGAHDAVRDAQLAALADTVRAVYRAAKSTPDNALEGVIRFADAAGVDLDGDGPAPVPDEPADADVVHLAVVIAEARLAGIRSGGYTLARAILQAGYTRGSSAEVAAIAHDTDGTTAYRFAAPGVLLFGQPRVRVSGNEWHLEQDDAGETVHAVAGDELGAILTLIARRHGLAALVCTAEDPPAEVPLDMRRDPAYARVFNAVSAGVAQVGRFLSLSDRDAVAAQVYQDLRAAGVIK
jgi:hypothetical protein